MTLATGNNSIDSLVFSSWASKAGAPVSLTYSFMTRVLAGGDAADSVGFAPMSAEQKVAARAALASWSAIANITFTEVATGGNIQFGTNDQGNDSSGYAYLPDGRTPTGLYLNNKDATNSIHTTGSYGNTVLIHEIGHTLGLKHPGDYNAAGDAVDGPFLPAATDNMDYSVMSYNNGQGTSQLRLYDTTPMMYDIQAIQYLYGANMAYHTGNDTYAYSAATAPLCIWDAGGSDTLDFSACTAATIINLNAGTFSSTAPGYNNVSIAFNVSIEKAIAGAGGSTIYGNNVGNVITGGAGADLIYQGAGNDTINGGGGNDTVVLAKGFASYTWNKSGSTLVLSGDGVDVLSNVETLQFSDRSIAVSALGSVITAAPAGGTLEAGTGSDLIVGGAGFDIVNYGGVRAGFQVAASGAGYTVTDTLGAGGTDYLSGVERLHFSDGSEVAFDTGSGQIAGEAYRLYQAAFNRTPDSGGLGYWIAMMDKGVSLHDVSASFLASKEFADTYGSNLSNAQLVLQLYTNVLHRTPDQGGYDWWVQRLNDGGQRADVLAAMSESAENVANVVGQISNGINYLHYV
ncbi:DUF4214 domain-containing protein [Oxalobacteraceae bacterium A2-2]